MRSPFLAFLAAVATAAPAASPPDAPLPVRVVTLDGRVLAGESLVPSGARLEVRAGAGSTAVDLAEVLEATIDIPAAPPGAAPGGLAVEVELVNRDLLKGALARGNGESGFILRSRVLGEIEVPVDLVAAVRFPAAWEKAPDPPPLRPAEKEDRFLFLSGDRLDGTLRSVTPEEIRVRAATGEERTVRTDALLGFALVAQPPKQEPGLRVQATLADGTRITGAALSGDGTSWTLAKTADGKDRTIPAGLVAGIAVRGGAGTCLADLDPTRVEVKPYWGDDPPVLPLRPVFDRAFTLDPGAPPPLRIGGRTWLRGVSMFSGMSATFDLAGKGFKSFTAAVAVDDAGPKGVVVFEVLVDGKSAWKSGPLGTAAPGAEPTAVPPLDVSGAKELSLVVRAGPGDDVQDFADWVRPVLR